MARLRRHTNLPIAVGFGIKSPEQAGAMARTATPVVVGSAIVEKIAQDVNPTARPIRYCRCGCWISSKPWPPRAPVPGRDGLSGFC